jgi:hypothetical protein
MPTGVQVSLWPSYPSCGATVKKNIGRGWYRSSVASCLKLRVPGYALIVYPRRQGFRWQARVYRRENGDRLYSRHYRTELEAVIAAHGLLVAMREYYDRKGKA